MMRKYIFLALLALALTACAPTAATTANSDAPLRTISVNGSGQAVLTPDIAHVTIGVRTEAASAQEALNKNNVQAQAVIDTLIKMGVEEKDIRTTDFSIYPNQRYDDNGNPLEIRYVVQNSVYVTIRNLDDLGTILDRVVRSGANRINGIQFDVADKTAALAAARDAAVAEARAQAEALAKAAGVSIDQVQTITFYNNVPAPVKADTRLMMAEAASAVPIQAGEMTLTVSVQMVFTIK